MLAAQPSSSSSSRSTSANGGGTSREQDYDDHDQSEHIRDIHALTPPQVPLPPPPAHPARARWETGSHHGSYSMSMSSDAGTSSSENFTTMSREFNALVLAGSSIGNNTSTATNNPHGSDNSNDVPVRDHGSNNNTLLSRIGEDDGDHDVPEETNPLAIVPDHNYPLEHPSSRRLAGSLALAGAAAGGGGGGREMSVQRVKKEEVDSKISAWQNAKIAKINNRFKREDAVINGWESEQVQKATSWMKKVERKLEEKRARALEKMQNEIAKARRKAEERRASAESRRGIKVARVLEVANLMRAVGRAPTKRSFF
ncbi:hypothetical protein Tsubulata_021192 [Turnera subulata]|uniref:Remorin C-terminal domain-containing protein n=1 Tax=Turnera subulata TaxID=218843 RepID=A0A9Q0F1H6_9ROSI|nr:hypothetical protein Tsubulata_049666 [Turnera subulata]KAJ4848761.1 hypothetical protein Tsubulata_021192 [Turnera subulata]